eukprot:752322-Hanusia_phi.AAC.2
MHKSFTVKALLCVFLLHQHLTSSLDSPQLESASNQRNMFGLSQQTYLSTQEQVSNDPYITSFIDAAEPSTIAVEHGAMLEEQRVVALLTAEDAKPTGVQARMVCRTLRGAKQAGQKSTKSTLRAKARIQHLAKSFLDSKKLKTVPFADTDTVLVPSLPDDISGVDLREALEKYGEVLIVDTNRIMHFARIKFNSSEPVNLILQRSPFLVKEQLLEFKPLLRSIPESSLQDADSNVEAKEGLKLIERVVEDKRPSMTLGVKFQRTMVECQWVSAGENSSFCFQTDQNAIVVHNLHPSTKEKEVIDKFSKCGKIKDVEVGDLVEGKSKYALIRFRDMDAMVNACEWDGMKFHGRVMRIRERGKQQSMADEFESMLDSRPPNGLDATLGSYKRPGTKTK